jgi:hypothetical protein
LFDSLGIRRIREKLHSLYKKLTIEGTKIEGKKLKIEGTKKLKIEGTKKLKIEGTKKLKIEGTTPVHDLTHKRSLCAECQCWKSQLSLWRLDPSHVALSQQLVATFEKYCEKTSLLARWVFTFFVIMG